MGDERETRATLESVYPLLASTAEHAIGNFFSYAPAEVEGAVAETMARLSAQWERLGPPSDPASAVLACANAVCVEHLQRSAAQSRKPDVALGGAAGFVDLADATVLSAALWQALQRLSKRQRDVAVVNGFMGCSESMTAAVLGTSVGVVRAAARRARARSPLLSSAEREPWKRPSRAHRRTAVVAGIALGLAVLVGSALLAAHTGRHDALTVTGKSVPSSQPQARAVHRKRPRSTTPAIDANARCLRLIAFVDKKKPKTTTTTTPPVTEPATTNPPPTNPPSTNPPPTEAPTTMPDTTDPPTMPPVTAAPTTPTGVGVQTPTTTRQTVTTDGTKSPTTVKDRPQPTVVANGVPTVTTPRRVLRTAPSRNGRTPRPTRSRRPRRAVGCA